MFNVLSRWFNGIIIEPRLKFTERPLIVILNGFIAKRGIIPKSKMR
ncbi:hypothetical protein MGWOODY_Mmi1789 [hydrothermal vent metagenome]|uniref:Uncharacterized protein n=1 Tax=hydrothermal vent metagenome TaxID=652676 RepID=A0A160VEB7_9ZZZZ